MKEFKPSSDFTARTMRKIRAYQRQQLTLVTRQEPIFSGLLRIAVSTGGVALGILNLVRLYSAVFSPIVCR